jgi:predicted TIM-barrel fold metal-dependent hydrolase
MTNYGNRYLGDREFGPLFDALNQHRVVVFVHPTVCDCDLDVLPGFAPPVIEFPHSTTRTVVSLLNSGTFVRCPSIRFIFAHAGGTIPFLAKRITRARPEWRSLLQRLYYDTASSADAAVFSSLLKLVTSKEILLGTDFPFAPPDSVRANLSDLQTLGLSDAELRDIDRRNAASLFPRFAG